MKLMYSTFLFFELFFPSASIATEDCSCHWRGVHEYYVSADFIAPAKIISMTENKSDSWSSHTAQIEIIELFKGEKRDTISVHTGSEAACGIWTEPGTTWLIVADKFRGRLSFGYCSSSTPFKISEPMKTTGRVPENKRRIERKLIALRLLRDKFKELSNLDRENTHFGLEEGGLDQFTGISPTEGPVAFYLVTFKAGNRVELIKPIHEFKDQELSQELRTTLKEQLKLRNYAKFDEKVTLTGQRLVGIYYYPAQDGKPSFLSIHDL